MHLISISQPITIRSKATITQLPHTATTPSFYSLDHVPTVGRTHTIARLQTRIRRKDGTDNFGVFVHVLGGFPQRDFVLWVFMCPINFSLYCLYCRSFSSYHAPRLSLFRPPRQGLPRHIYTPRAITPRAIMLYHHCTAITPQVYIYPDYHAIVQLYSWVVTPELSRSTTHVHRVLTPAIVSSS